jgi:hypothetical protein
MMTVRTSSVSFQSGNKITHTGGSTDDDWGDDDDVDINNYDYCPAYDVCKQYARCALLKYSWPQN